jgi:hypothetical protein
VRTNIQNATSPIERDHRRSIGCQADDDARPKDFSKDLLNADLPTDRNLVFCIWALVDRQRELGECAVRSIIGPCQPRRGAIFFPGWRPVRNEHHCVEPESELRHSAKILLSGPGDLAKGSCYQILDRCKEHLSWRCSAWRAKRSTTRRELGRAVDHLPFSH